MGWPERRPAFDRGFGWMGGEPAGPVGTVRVLSLRHDRYRDDRGCRFRVGLMDRIRAAVIEILLASVCIALAIGVMLLMVAAR